MQVTLADRAFHDCLLAARRSISPGLDSIHDQRDPGERFVHFLIFLLDLGVGEALQLLALHRLVLRAALEFDRAEVVARKESNQRERLPRQLCVIDTGLAAVVLNPIPVDAVVHDFPFSISSRSFSTASAW